MTAGLRLLINRGGGAAWVTAESHIGSSSSRARENPAAERLTPCSKFRRGARPLKLPQDSCGIIATGPPLHRKNTVEALEMWPLFAIVEIIE
jgi:hypothetical protein